MEESVIENTDGELVVTDKYKNKIHLVRYSSGCIDIDIDGNDVILSKEATEIIKEWINKE
ncbi:hypothetical protein KY328_02080 [Candidatus Woesearchaeota archaeon]|nr:hypothetical protein [Candidatus Woesearchaeota archaeon]